MAYPNHFWKADRRRFWYFDVSVWSDEKSCAFWGGAKMVFWLILQGLKTQIPPKDIQAPPIS